MKYLLRIELHQLAASAKVPEEVYDKLHTSLAGLGFSTTDPSAFKGLFSTPTPFPSGTYCGILLENDSTKARDHIRNYLLQQKVWPKWTFLIAQAGTISLGSN